MREAYPLSDVAVDVRKASQLLKKAYEQSPCKWCARNLDKLSKITSDMADIAPYTEETSKRVSVKTQAELQEIGGKVGVLRKVVMDSRDGNITDVSEDLNNQDINVFDRGLFMDKKSAGVAAIGAVALGGGLGFVLNRVDDMVSAGQPVYMHVGPLASVGLGAVMTMLGTTKYIKGDKAKMFIVGGGLGLLSNGVLTYAEGLYKSGISAGYTPNMQAPGRRYVNARIPGQLPQPRQAQVTRSY